MREGIDLARRKGFPRVYGHARQGLEPFWARFGGRPIEGSSHFVFSDFAYTEMVLELGTSADAINLSSGPMVILRPEGDWDRPGILDHSSGRPIAIPAIISSKETDRLLKVSRLGRTNSRCRLTTRIQALFVFLSLEIEHIVIGYLQDGNLRDF